MYITASVNRQHKSVNEGNTRSLPLIEISVNFAT